MAHLPPRKLDPRELKDILEALDPIFGGAKPAAPAPPRIDETSLPKSWEPPEAPPKKKKEKTLPPHKPAVPYTEPPKKKEKTLPPHKPAAPYAFPPDDIPAGTPEAQVRRLALFYSPGCEAAAARVLGYLAEIGRKCKQPIYLRKALVSAVDEAAHPKALALKARVEEASAAVAVFYGLPKAALAEWEAAMRKERVRFHQLAPEQAADRAILVEIMGGLLVFDPSAPREYGWEDHGHDGEHGIKREPWR